MHYLRCVSILLLLAACAPRAYRDLVPAAADKECVQAFQPQITRALYYAQVDVSKYHLSGILVIKQLPDSTTRIVFTNEAGFTFFDFEFDKNQAFKVHKIMPKMNRKMVIETLRKDFQLVLMNGLQVLPQETYTLNGERYTVLVDGKDRYYYITSADCKSLLRMERGSKKRKVVVAGYGDVDKSIPQSITIKHTNFKFHIQLTQFNNDAAE